MQSVTKLAVVDKEKCSACLTCVRLCPVEAISLDKSGEKPVASVDSTRCLACTICVTRCPEDAFQMVERDRPLPYGIDFRQAPQEEVERICQGAHMYPEQIICYCRRTQARDVAAAIIRGAKTPEEIARATGIRTGCGVLCITSVLRLLRAAGIQPEKAPGWQWYGAYLTIWDIPREIMEKYPEYYLAEDFEAMNKVFPGGNGK